MFFTRATVSVGMESLHRRSRWISMYEDDWQDPTVTEGVTASTGWGVQIDDRDPV